MGERTGFYNSGGRNQVDIPDIPDIPSVSINLN
jgi:hypothetical protein